MKLSARLQAVADLALPDLPAADIGCDHAQLAAWWVHSGRVPRAVASDLRPGPLAQARASLEALGIEGVDVRLGSGLSTLAPGEAATIALAGMGGQLMVSLLEACPDVVRSARRIILQPNTAWGDVRRHLAGHGIALQAETLTDDGGHLYLTLAFDPTARGATWTEADIVLGPLLRRARPPLMQRWITQRRAHLQTLRQQLEQRLGAEHPRIAELTAEAAVLERAVDSSIA
jgi:tRNA (adenine22-N1)-methyltransferase